MSSSADDVRNNKSWRLENKLRHKPLSPQPSASAHIQFNESTGRTNKKSNGVKTDQSLAPTSNKTTAIEMESPEVPQIRSIVWRNLSEYIKRFIDDMYLYCEEEEDNDGCREIAGQLLERVTDFTNLADRIESQRKLEQGETQSAAWVVSTRDMTSTVHVDSTTPPGHRLKSLLRATANEFTPSATTKKLFSVEKVDSDRNTENNEITAHLARVAESNNNIFSQFSPSRGRAFTESNVIPHRVHTSGTSHSTGAGRFPAMEETHSYKHDSSGYRNSTAQMNKAQGGYRFTKATHSNSGMDEHVMESKVEQARERVWKEAEALADAALFAEEEQWVSLGMSQRQTFRKKFSGSNTLQQLQPTESSPSDHDNFDDDFILTTGFKKDQSYNRSGRSLLGSTSKDYVDVSDDLPMAPLLTPNLSTGYGRESFSTSYRASSSSLHGSPFYTPSGSFSVSYISPSPSSGGRALHNKLSSPDRKRQLSPDELRRRQTEKMDTATANRENSNKLKQQKAAVASARVDEVNKKVALQTSQKGEQLQRKQSEAELRRLKAVNVIKDRAGNENNKVEEVIFINALNSECVADELNKKLLEAEARVLAAEGRRQQRLDEISSQQKTRNYRRAQQMSETRMEQERIKMERFEKLQQKLRDVESRKNERLIEMKRRDEVDVIVIGKAVHIEGASANVPINAQDFQIESNNQVIELKKLSKKEERLILQQQKQLEQAKVDEDKVSKQNKKKNRKAKKKSDGSNVLLSASRSDEMISVDTAPMHSEIKGETTTSTDVTASLDCISEAYKAVQLGIQKKTTLAARNACVNAALVNLMSSDKRTESNTEDIHMTRLLQTNSNNSVSTATKFSTIATQLLASEVPISAISDADLVGGGGGTRHHSPTHSTSIEGPIATEPSERQIKWNISLLLCTVDISDSTVIQFIDDGGVMLLRVLLGYEIGILSSVNTFSEILNCSADPTLGKSLGLIIFELVGCCSATVQGKRQLFAYGIPVLMADIVSILFNVQERLCRDTAHFQKYSDSLSEYSNVGIVSAKEVTFPYCVTVLLPRAVKTISKFIVRDLLSAVSDTFLWYLFNCGVFVSLCDSLRSDVQCLQYRQTRSQTVSDKKDGGVANYAADYKQYKSVEARDSIVCNAQLITSICVYLRTSRTGGDDDISDSPESLNAQNIVRSVSQLSSQSSAHPKGRQIVSLLRRSEVVSTVVALLLSLIVEFEYCNAAANNFVESVKTTRRGNVVHITHVVVNTAAQLHVYSSLIEAIYSVASADMSLVQQLTKNSHIQFVNCVNYLIRSYVVSLDNGNTVNVFAPTAECQFTKSDAEKSIQKLLLTTALCCLRNIELQKECATSVNIQPRFAPEIVSHTKETPPPTPQQQKATTVCSLLSTLCRLSNKFYKDKKFKHCLLPCLLAMTMDVDSNIACLRTEEKLTSVYRYLEYLNIEIKKYSEESIAVNNKVKECGDRQPTSAQLSSSYIDPLEILIRVSQVFPADLWSTALVTYSSRL